MSFKEQVIAAVKKIPKGKVASYGQIAAAIGSPRAARQVGQALRNLDNLSETPWWRIINSAGFISIKGNRTATKQLQKDLLIHDGVEVGKDFKVKMQRYQWRATKV